MSPGLIRRRLFLAEYGAVGLEDMSCPVGVSWMSLCRRGRSNSDLVSRDAGVSACHVRVDDKLRVLKRSDPAREESLPRPPLSSPYLFHALPS